MLNEKGEIALRRRPEKGLLGGMMEIPSTDWRGEIWDDADALALSPVKLDWRLASGEVRHVFTHFELRLRLALHVDRKAAGKRVADIIWVAPDRLDDYALPTVMRKVVALALASTSLL